MRHPLGLCAFVLLSTPALADIEPICEELWFARNAMLDDAGYCFATPLGRSIFDNSDCTTKSPNTDAAVAEQIALIQQLEKEAPYTPDGICRVDTTQTSLPDVSYIDLRRRLTFQPATDGGAGACVGYKGDPLILRAAPDMDAEILGQVLPSASVSLSHLPWNGWNFAIAWYDKTASGPTILGWYRGDIVFDAGGDGTSENCAFLAG